MDINSISVYGALVATILSAIGGYITARATFVKAARETEALRVKADAEKKSIEAGADKTVGEAWASLYDRLRMRVDQQDMHMVAQDAQINDLRKLAESERQSRMQLEGRVSELEQENKDLKTWSEALVGQLRNAQIEPAPFVRSKKGR